RGIYRLCMGRGDRSVGTHEIRYRGYPSFRSSKTGISEAVCMRVLVFGDSITQGYWAVEHGWVDRVRKYFDARQFEDLGGRDEPTIFNLGISADNSNDILSRIESEVAARTRDHHEIK